MPDLSIQQQLMAWTQDGLRLSVAAELISHGEVNAWLLHCVLKNHKGLLLLEIQKPCKNSNKHFNRCRSKKVKMVLVSS